MKQLRTLLVIIAIAATLGACASMGSNMPYRSQSELGDESVGRPMDKYDTAYYHWQRARGARR